MASPLVALPALSFAERLRQLLRLRPGLASLALALGPILAALACFTPWYETNDDPSMNLIASGYVINDRPDEHILFSNVVSGLVLKWLYVNAPALPWFGLGQIASMTIAALVTVYVLVRSKPDLRQAAVALLYIVTAVVPSVIEVQFTKTAFFVSFAGLLLLAGPLCGLPHLRIADIAGCALVVAGSLIRYESALLAFVATLPLATALALRRPTPAAWRLVPVLLSVAICFAFNQFNRYYYARDDGWKEFYDYNTLRAEFTDYGHYYYCPETAAAFNAAGWNQNDFYMMVGWFFADRDRFSLARMRQIAGTVPHAPPRSLSAVIEEFAESLRTRPSLLILIAAVIVSAFFAVADIRSAFLCAAYIVLPFALMMFLGCYFWAPFRIAYPLFAAALAGAAVRVNGAEAVIGASPPEPRRPLPCGNRIAVCLRMAGGLAAVALMVGSLCLLKRDNDTHLRRYAAMQRILVAMKPQPETLFVLWSGWFPLEELVHPLQDLQPLRALRCLPAGAMLPTPITEQRLREFHITDIYLAICRRPDVLVIAAPEFIEEYRQYMLDHYAICTEHRILLATAGVPQFFGDDNQMGFDIFQIRQQTLDSLPAHSGGRPMP